MNDFNYYAPTKVVFGKGAEQKVGNLIKEQNCKKVLIHYGSGSARRSGLLDRIEAIFDKEGITYVELGGVVPNPRLSLVYEGIALCKKENVDFILAVGGGSVIDSAKAIGYGVANEGDVWDFFDFKHDYLFDEIVTNMPVRGKMTREQLDRLYEKFFRKALTILEKEAVIVMYTGEIGFVKKQLRLHMEFSLLEEYCMQSKAGCYLLIIGVKR